MALIVFLFPLTKQMIIAPRTREVYMVMYRVVRVIIMYIVHVASPLQHTIGTVALIHLVALVQVRIPLLFQINIIAMYPLQILHM